MFRHNQHSKHHALTVCFGVNVLDGEINPIGLESGNRKY